jgi:RNA polymerase sigma-70 factor, ECF subfamily
MASAQPPHLVLCSLTEPPLPQGDSGEGEPLSMEAAYKKYSAYVAYVGIRIIGRDDEIDDLVQDVFIEAIRGLKTLRDAGAIKGWLATVTVRVATRRLRMRKLKRALGFTQVDTETVWPGASPEQNAAVSKVYRSLERVPAKQRAAWILRVVEQEPLDQVAQSCGCSLATAKRWIADVQSVVLGERNLKGQV